jgi:hypothetical protein
LLLASFAGVTEKYVDANYKDGTAMKCLMDVDRKEVNCEEFRVPENSITGSFKVFVEFESGAKDQAAQDSYLKSLKDHINDINFIEDNVGSFLVLRLRCYNVQCRKSGRDIPRPVWFVYEGNILYLLPDYGSDTNWYKNVLVDPTLKVSVNGIEILATGELITDSNRVAVSYYLTCSKLHS